MKIHFHDTKSRLPIRILRLKRNTLFASPIIKKGFKQSDGGIRKFYRTTLIKQQKPPITLSRQKLMQLFIVVSLAGMATQSITANANVFDPIKKVFSSFKTKSSEPSADEGLPESGQLITEQQPLDPTISSHPAEARSNKQLTQDRPSLLNIMQAEFLVDRGDINKALELYKQESFKQDATSVFERTLDLSLLYEPPNDSLAFALEWQQQNPEHIPALFYVAHLALKANQYGLAGEVLSQILEYDPMADLSEILIGIYPTNESDQRLLLQTLLSLPKHENPSLLVIQSGLMSQLGQPEIGLVSINRALQSQPDTAPFIVLKADILKQLKPADEVLDYISTERKRLKNNQSLYLYEIRYRLELNQTREAWELLVEAHDLFDDGELSLLAALVSIDIEAYAKADDILSSLASSPSYIDQAYYYLGISAERQHNLARAERFFSKVMQENLVLKARQKLVSIQLLQGHPDLALNTLTKLSQQFPVYAPDSAIMQAEILRQQNKLDEAQRILAETNQVFPDDTKLLYARAQLLNSDQDIVLKRRLLERLLLLDPENSDYKLSWAVLLFQGGDNKEIDEALLLAQSIVDIPFDAPNFKQSNYIAALNLLAAEALSEGRFEDAINYLEYPYDIFPTLDSGIILLRAYQGLGQEDKVTYLFNDIQQRYALGHQALNDRLQSY